MKKLNKAKETINRVEKLEDELRQVRQGYIKLMKSFAVIMERQNIIVRKLQAQFPELELIKELPHESRRYKETQCICKYLWINTKGQYQCTFCDYIHVESDASANERSQESKSSL